LFACLFGRFFLFSTSKFLAESVDGGKFLVYNRWGRVGKKGQDKLQDHSSRESAIKEFEQKFLAKTKNAWSDRNNFVFHPKSYAWLEMDYSGKEKESKVSCADSIPLVTFSLSLFTFVCSFAINSSHYPMN
jgi:predicted DNA-binding WGR domain protein